MEIIYDAFVSSSKSDSSWVDTFLLPSLEAAGLKVCVPSRDYTLGLPEVLNVELAIQRSRKILLVLTPDWIASEWSALESLLSQTDDPAGLRRRTLPLLLEDCSLPPRLRALTSADFRESGQWPHQIQRVIRSIVESEITGVLPKHLDDIIRLFLVTNFERDQYARLDQAGESDDRTTLLRKVFVDLNVKIKSGPQRDYKWLRSEFTSEFFQAQTTGKPVSAMRWLLSDRKFKAVIVGGPGQGKSTLGQYLAQAHRASLLNRQQEMAGHAPGLASARKQELLPALPRITFRIILKYFAQWMDNHGDSGTVESYILDQIRIDALHSVSVEEVHTILRLRPILMIFDGLDEVIEASLRTRLLYQIQEFTQRAEYLGANLQVIATSRPTGYTDQFSPEHFWHLELQPMSAEKVRDYAVRWMLAKVGMEEERRRILETLNECQAEEHTKLLLTTPLQVSIVLVIIKDGGRPPAQREALFHEYWSTIFRRERAKGKGVIRSEESLLFGLHAFLGYLLHRKALRENVKSLLSREEFEECVIKFLLQNDRRAKPNIIRQRATEIVQEATGRLVLLVEPEPDLFGFELRSIQEFFAAVYLSQSARDTTIRFKRLRAIALSEHWRNVALFFAGRVTRNFDGEAASILELVCRPIDRTMPDLLLKRGAWLALDIASDGVFSNRDLQYGAIEHGLSVLDGVVPRSKKSRLQSALTRLSPDDRREMVRPILRRRIRDAGRSCELLPDLLELLGQVSGTKKALLEGLEVLMEGSEQERAEAFRLAIRFRVEPEWLAREILKHWESFLKWGAFLWSYARDGFKYMLEAIGSASLTNAQASQLMNTIAKSRRPWPDMEFLRLTNDADSIEGQIALFCSCLQLISQWDRDRSLETRLLGLVLRPLVVDSEPIVGRTKAYSGPELLDLLRRRDLLPSLRLALWSIYWSLERPRGTKVDRFLDDIEVASKAGVDRDVLRILRFDLRWPLLGAAVVAYAEQDRVQLRYLAQALREDRSISISSTVQEQLVTMARTMEPSQWVNFTIALQSGHLKTTNEELESLASGLGITQDKLINLHVRYFTPTDISPNQALEVISLIESLLSNGGFATPLVVLLGQGVLKELSARKALRVMLAQLCRLGQGVVRDLSSMAELLAILGNIDSGGVTLSLARTVAKFIGQQEGGVIRVTTKIESVSFLQALGTLLGARDLNVRRGIIQLFNSFQAYIGEDNRRLLFTIAVFKWTDLERGFDIDPVSKPLVIRLLKSCAIPMNQSTAQDKLLTMIRSASAAEVPAWREFLGFAPIEEGLRDAWCRFLESVLEERQVYAAILASALERYALVIGQSTAGNVLGEAELELPE